ncbi:MAG: EVE domain-containing protein [Chloroflexi bacterium]|nr:EVE domain-containing protein [Chloroflexota bacterium]
MNNEATVAEWIGRLRGVTSHINPATWPTATLNRAPHKALLLLAVIDLVDSGQLSDAQIEASDALVGRYEQLWRCALPGRTPAGVVEPFTHLVSDGFWHLVGPNGVLSRETALGIRSLVQLRATIVGAAVDSQLFDLLMDPEVRPRLRQALLETYFDSPARDRLTAAQPATPPDPRRSASYWWVNQGVTYDQERQGGYVWASKRTKTGREIAHHTNVGLLKPGDLLFHYARRAICATGRVTASPEDAVRPQKLPEGAWTQKRGAWTQEGRLARIDYEVLEKPIPLIDIPEAWRKAEGGPFNAAGAVKQGYLFPLRPEFAQRLLERVQPAKGPAPHKHRTWIFQANPQLWNLRAALQILTHMTWLVNRHRDEVRQGDHVYLWESGREGGLWASAEVLTDVEDLTDRPEEAQFRVESEPIEGTCPRVRLRVLRALSQPVPRQALKADPRLAQMTLLRFAQGTNFPVTDEEAAVLKQYIAGQAPPDSTAASKSAFASLLETLAHEGLHFSEELVANYLLALQTKRFAIVTGISGTGKTGLALAVARHFRPLVRGLRPDPTVTSAVEVSVKPYMLGYHKLVLPKALMLLYRLPPRGGKPSAPVNVRYPEGEAQLSVYHDVERDVVHLTFRERFRSWFDANVRVGDSLLIDVDTDPDGENDCLRFALPSPALRVPLDNCVVMAVRPEWTDNRGLLGYYNPLTQRYSTTPALDLLLRAAEDVEAAKREGRAPHPFFLILDEMNLARVEHYFSDFLSCLESDQSLHLHSDPRIEAGESDDARAVPRQLLIPPNVFFTGTVNVDETTYMFSPKVLDRAFTLEFNDCDLEGYGPGRNSASPQPGPLHLSGLPDSLVPDGRPSADDWDVFSKLDAKLHRVVLDLHALLVPDHRHFGYRVANEIARFVVLAADQTDGSEKALWAALDLGVLEKILPKLHGTQQELEELLRQLFEFAVAVGRSDVAAGMLKTSGWKPDRGGLRPTLAQGQEDAPKAALPRTATKLWRMLRRLERQGFTSFME